MRHRYRVSKQRVLEYSDQARVEITAAVISGMSDLGVQKLLNRMLVEQPNEVRLVADEEEKEVLLN